MSETGALVETVLKVGGGLLEDLDVFDAVLSVVRAAAPSRRLLIVPGGGPFADVVRHVDRRIGLSDTSAHWMAVLAMDQYAHLITARLAGAVLAAEPPEIAAAIDDHHIPVLAPSRWLREADPLPHSWDVTSDSIAAWVAGRVGARRLVLVKPPGVRRSDGAVDRYFARALPAGLATRVIGADEIDLLRSVLMSHP